MAEPLPYRLASVYLRTLGAQARRLETPTGTIHAFLLDDPTAPPQELVLLHGLSASAGHCVPMLRHLRGRFRRVIVPDLLGHGRSSTPPRMDGEVLHAAMKVALDQLIGQRAVVYGNSLGGYAAIRYAAASPERVSALMVHAPAGGRFHSMTVQAYLDRFRVDTHQQALEMLAGYLGRPPRGVLRHVLARSALRQLRRPRVRALISTLSEADFLHPDHLAAVPAPTRLLWGGRDRMMLPEQLDALRAHLPTHAQVEVVPDYGHAPYIEMPADLARRLLAFVDEAGLRL